MKDKEIEQKMINDKMSVNENCKIINTCIHFETLTEQVKNSCPLFSSSLVSSTHKLQNQKKLKKEKNNISISHDYCQYNDPNSNKNRIDGNKEIINFITDDFGRTLTAQNRFTEFNPTCDVVFERRGNIKIDLGNFFETIENNKSLLEIIPVNAIFFKNRGNAKNKIGDYLAAIEDYTKAIECNPDDSIVFAKRGIAEINLGDYDKALLDFNMSVRINPNNAETYNSRGVGKAKQGNYVGALADFNRAIEINPFDEEAHNNRGTTKYNLHNKMGASLDWSKAGELRMRKRWINYNSVFEKHSLKSGI